MIRKNLILLIIKDHEDNDEMYLSNYIPGCLDWDEYIDKIKYNTTVGYPKNAVQNLTYLKENSKIIFSRVENFCFNPSRSSEKKLDIVDNLYIINTTEEYKDIYCSSSYVDDYYCQNDFISCPKSISCFSLVSTINKYMKYEVRTTIYKEE